MATREPKLKILDPQHPVSGLHGATNGEMVKDNVDDGDDDDGDDDDDDDDDDDNEESCSDDEFTDSPHEG